MDVATPLQRTWPSRGFSRAAGQGLCRAIAARAASGRGAAHRNPNGSRVLVGPAEAHTRPLASRTSLAHTREDGCQRAPGNTSPRLASRVAQAGRFVVPAWN